MNREIYNKIREFSVDMYTQGFSDGYTDGSTKGVEVEKAQEYKRGFENGYSQGWDEAYKKGLNDAWECARKITNDMTSEDLESCNLFANVSYDEDYEYSCKVIKMYSSSEAIDKLKEHTSKPKQNIPINKCATCTHKDELREYCSDCISYYKYEEMCCDNCALNLTECTDLDHFCDYKKWKLKQDESIPDQYLESKDTPDKDISTDSNYGSEHNEDECVDDEIRVGDEVILYDSYKGVVISVPYDDRFNVLGEDDNVWTIYAKDTITKTGRHFSLITEMLNQLKEEIKE